jgi:DNA primase small subunit
MRIETKAFIEERFREYYRTADLPAPAELEHREWGVIPHDAYEGVMVRHKAFKSIDAMREFLTSRNVSYHVYHSSSYYNAPGAPTMAEKGWLGADLVFDIDADPKHIPEVKDMPFSGQLVVAKREAAKLIDTFLIDELGFTQSQIEIVFSGGRGYHIHVPESALRNFTSQDRREMVDYVTGHGLDFEHTLYVAERNNEGGVRAAKASSVWKVRNFDNSGWGKRIGTYLYDQMEALAKGTKKDAVAYAEGIGMSNQKAGEAYDFMCDEANRILMRDSGKLKLGDNGLDAFFRAMLTKNAQTMTMKYGCPVDAPVTTDIKRLIRMPGSLHGKTSLKVVPLTYDEFKTFDPLTSAVAFPDDVLVPIWIQEPKVIEIRGQRIKINGPGRGKVPMSWAMYMFCQNMADLQV